MALLSVKTIEWTGDAARIIDQTKLPAELVYLDIRDHTTMGEAIKMLRIRGAPAIGAAAAFGVYLGVRDTPDSVFYSTFEEVTNFLVSTRPTAINLFWAVKRLRDIVRKKEKEGEPVGEVKQHILEEASLILEEDRQICRRIGANGAMLLKDNSKVLTHCNAGALATVDYGTALGVIYSAVEQGKKIHVFADETRPLLQGARLTTWEMIQAGIEVTLLCDNMAATAMRQGLIDSVIVGADRIASNGDVANKIGTYNVAVLAEKHNIPFYVAAPISTIDFDIKSGDEIPIEERAAEEVTEGFGYRTAPPNIDVFSPAFDITPNELVQSIITEKEVHSPPFHFKREELS